MASASRKLQIIISGDAKGALGAFAETEAGAGGLGSKLGAVAGAIPAVFAAAGVGAAVGLFKIGESFDEQYDKIRATTGKTGEALGALQDDFKQVLKDVPTSFGDAGTAIANLNQKLGLTGTPLSTLADQFLELSRITKTDVTANIKAGTDAINQWGIVAGQQPQFLDELFRVSQNTGISFGDLADSLANNGPILQAAGVDWESSAALLGTLAKNGLDASDVMPALSKALANAAKEGKGASQFLTEAFDAIKNAPDDTAAASEALKDFGAKAGPKMAELIRSGKLGYEDLVKSISTGGDTIMQAGKDTQDFGEKWELLKNRVLVALEPVATKVFDSIGKAMDNLGPFIDKMQIRFEAISKWVEQHWPEISKTIEGAMKRISDITSSVIALVEVLWDTLGVRIAALVETVFPYIVQVISGAMTIIQGIIDTVTAIISGDWSAAWQGMQDIVAGAVDMIEGMVGGLAAAIESEIGTAMAFVGEVWVTVWGAMGDALGYVYDHTIGPVIDFIASKIDWLADKLGQLQDILSTLSNPLGGNASFEDVIKSKLSHPGTNAAGTSNWGGGLTWVGEQGPELVNLPAGSQVFPNSKSMAMAGGPNVYVTVNAGLGTDGNAVGQTILEYVEKALRSGGAVGSYTKAAITG